LAGITLLGVVFLYPLANLFRGNGGGSKTGATVFASIDFDGFQQVINSVAYVRDTGHSDGHYVLSALLFFVPRSLWASKATPASIDVATHRGYAFTNLSLPLDAELFIDFGAVVMILILLTAGTVLGRMDTLWLVAPASRSALMVPYLGVAMLGVIRGPLGSAAPVYLTVIGLLFIAIRPVREQGSADATSKIGSQPLAAGAMVPRRGVSH
jgi:hypothetical protein